MTVTVWAHICMHILQDLNGNLEGAILNGALGTPHAGTTRKLVSLHKLLMQVLYSVVCAIFSTHVLCASFSVSRFSMHVLDDIFLEVFCSMHVLRATFSVCRFSMHVLCAGFSAVYVCFRAERPNGRFILSERALGLGCPTVLERGRRV